MLSIFMMTLAVIIGILWGIYLEINFLSVSLIFLSIFMLVYFKRFFNTFAVLAALCIIMAGVTKVKINNFDSKFSDDIDLKFKVTILSHLEETDFYYKYNCKNDENEKFVLYFKKNESNFFNIGDRLNIEGTFVLPDVARNKGGFNYRRTLNSNGIYGSIKVQNFTKEKPSKNPVYLAQNLIYNNFKELLPKELAGVLGGMIIGETTSISKQTEENFKNAGVSHLLAVSGSNVALVIAFSTFIFAKLFGKKCSKYFSIIFIIFFVCLAGSSPSVVRAGVMAILTILANIFIRKSESFTNVFSSAFIILIFNPLSLINIGFILSFLGTLGIIVLQYHIDEFLSKFIKNETVRNLISVTFAAQLMLLPVLIYFFNSISVISIFSNLLIIPITSLVTILGIVLFFISLLSMSLARIVSYLIIPMINYILTITRVCAGFEVLNITIPTPKIWMIAAFYIWIFLKIYKNNYDSDTYLEKVSDTKYRYIMHFEKYFKVFVITALIVTVIYVNVPKGYTEFTAIDVGQGDAFLIVTNNNKKILIDGGGSENSSFDVGANTLVPYLLDRGFLKIDYVFISHAHADHIDGIYTVIQKLKVGKVYIGAQAYGDEKVKKLYDFAKENGVSIKQISEGTRFKIDNVRIDILYPEISVKEENANNLSLIMKVFCNGRKILFTGDAEVKVEEKLDFDLSADILKVPHHGSSTSSSEEFIDKVSPKISIISLAENNLYGHPNVTVLKRLKEKGEVFMTKDFGEINIEIYKNGAMHIFTFLDNTTFILK